MFSGFLKTIFKNNFQKQKPNSPIVFLFKQHKITISLQFSTFHFHKKEEIQDANQFSKAQSQKSQRGRTHLLK